jgi:hypothetical protein
MNSYLVELAESGLQAGYNEITPTRKKELLTRVRKNYSLG